jgi:hypothetical protein
VPRGGGGEGTVFDAQFLSGPGPAATGADTESQIAIRRRSIAACKRECLAGLRTQTVPHSVQPAAHMHTHSTTPIISENVANMAQKTVEDEHFSSDWNRREF